MMRSEALAGTQSSIGAGRGPGDAAAAAAAVTEPAAARGRIPVISRPLLRWFGWYSRRYIRRHFHSLRVSNAGPPPQAHGLPIVLYSNHASWWDPLVCLVLKERFYPGHEAFAPMDAAMLNRYRMFARLGFFPVERGTRRGALHFLRTAEAILRSPGALLALTPQGRFADARERPVRFEAGLGHLASRVGHALFVPVALEYVHWAERLPEILVRFGEPVEVRRKPGPALDADHWTGVFERKLTDAQDALAVEAQRRDRADFAMALAGSAGQGNVYDLWQWLNATLRGQEFHREHGSQ